MLFKEEKQSTVVKTVKVFFVVLMLGFFIILPYFVLAEKIETEKETTTNVLEARNIETQLSVLESVFLRTIKQGILKIKGEVIILGQEIQKTVELIKRGKLEKEEEEDVVQATSTEEAIIKEATSTEATSTEAIKETEEDNSSTEIIYNRGGSGFVSDTITPAAITDLSASDPIITSISVIWTAPGDDSNSGTATSYDIRYSTITITNANWDSASKVIGIPTPLPAGSTQSITISNLSYGTTYYFAIKSSDEISNESELSNIASQTTNAPEECSSPIASGSQIYFVRTQNMPQIMRIDIDELSIGFGDIQTVSAQIRDTNSNSITSVSGTILSDNGSSNFILSLVGEDDMNGNWQGSWSPTDTLCTIYSMIITATSASGESNVTLSFR